MTSDISIYTIVTKIKQKDKKNLLISILQEEIVIETMNLLKMQVPLNKVCTRLPGELTFLRQL